MIVSLLVMAVYMYDYEFEIKKIKCHEIFILQGLLEYLAHYPMLVSRLLGFLQGTQC